MRVKVYGQRSVQGADSLCDSGRLAHVVRGQRVDDTLTFRQASPVRAVRITLRVATCSEYVDDREPSYAKFMEKAWILTPGSKRREAGFVRASDLKGDEALRCFTDPTDRE